jgi:hypothetical protein
VTERIPVSEAELAKEFRLRRVRGSAVDAVTNPAIRICLTTCAELRKKQREPQQPDSDLKRLAAGDSD